MKIRLDKALVERGLAASRERATALVLAGRVLVSEQRVEKPGTAIDQAAPLRLLGDDLRYVGRGGLKLERALQHWRIALDGRACVDVGASTGGFTDCMLQHGAASVLRSTPATARSRTSCALTRASVCASGAMRGCSQPGSWWSREQGRRDREQGRARRALMERHRRSRFLRWMCRSSRRRWSSPLSCAGLCPWAWCGAARRSSSSSRSSRQAASTWARVGSCASRRGGYCHRAGQAVCGRVGGTEIEVIDSPIHGMEGNWEYLLHACFGGGELETRHLITDLPTEPRTEKVELSIESHSWLLCLYSVKVLSFIG